MAESASGLMTEVATLTHATTQLLNSVNVRKVTLDEKVDAAAASAQASAQSAAASSDSATLAATALDEAETARDTTLHYRDQAVAVVTSNDGSFESAPGKVPVAGLDGKIDYAYLPLLEHNAKVAEALIRATHENLQDFFDDRTVGTQVASNATRLSSLTAHVDAQVQRLDAQIKGIEPGIPPVYKGLIEQDFLIDGFESAYTAEILRGMGGSGLYSTRNYSVDDGFQALHRPFTVTSTAQFQHNHPNYYRMVGLGELCAIVNGYYVRTTHNDPTLIDQDGTILSAPAVPTAVLAKPTGVTLNANGTVSIDTASDTQARYMRNLFTNSLEDTRLDLLYLEVWLEKLPAGGELNTTIQSFRHQENANRLRDLLNFAEKLNFSGAKDLPENGSFRCGVITFVDANGVPEYAYVNYRLRARSVGKLAPRVAKTSYSTGDQTPSISFGVVASSFGGTHGHALDVPLTAAEMNTLIGGGTLYVETSYGKSPASADSESHAHLRSLSWNGSTLVGSSLGARAVGAPANTFTAVSSTPPSIASYRKADGSYAGPVLWNTSAVPHQHPMDVQMVQDRFPFDLAKAVSHTIDNSNRFKLVKDIEALNRLREGGSPNAGWVELALSGLARFTLDQDSMDALCSQVWGLDGEGAFIPEAINSYGTTFTTYNVVGTAQANLAKYNRTYKIGTNDAAGRTVARRGFNDPTLYVARTTKPNVVEGYGMTAAGIAAAQAAMGTIGFGLMAAGVSVLGAFLVNALVPLPNPSVPSAQNGIAPSPTYSLQSQGNFARLLQPVPVIYGRHLVYPDLGATPYTEYINNEQYLHQLLVIGQGDYAIEAVRIEDTPIQSFSEVQAQLILPGGQNTLFNHDVVTAPEVAGQELLAIDDPANTQGETVGPFIVNPPETRIDAIGIDILLPRGLFYANDAGGQDPKEVRWTVQVRAVNDSGEPTTGWQTLVLSTNYGAWSAWNPTWSSANAITTQTYHYDSEGGYYSTRYGPPPLPANTPTEEYQLGDCSNQDWESGTCYAYYIQRRTRAAYPQQEVISGAYAETVRRSYRYPVTAGRYEVRVIRGDHKDTRARAGHELRWGEVRGYLVNPSLPAGITFLAVKMRATDNLSMRSSRLINCLVTRKLPVWHPSTGWSPPQATRSIAWAFADAVRADYGAKLADSRIDLPALYRLDQTWAARGDQFDAVFDQKVTVWEALTRIARCGRAVPYLQSGVVRLVRDEPKTLPVARFTTANIVKGSFKLQYVMPGEETADAVTVEFFNPKTWKPSEVTVSLPGSTEANPATVNLFGCTSQAQAMREGKYIAAANRYRRRLITFRTEMEGLIPTFGDLIAISHDMPAQGTEATEGSAAGESADVPWSQLARVMAIRPRGEQVEIACVVEHPLVHTADR